MVVSLKLLMLCGARRDEIASLRWDEIDLDGALVTLPGERTKNGYPHEIAITRPMRAILETQQRDSNGNGRDLVFGRGAGGFQDFSGSKNELDQRITAAREARGLGPMAPWAPHDFRRSLSTTMNEALNVPRTSSRPFSAMSLHKAGVAGVYNKSLYRDDKRAALERWSAVLMATINGGKGIVRRKRKVPRPPPLAARHQRESRS